MLLSSFAIAELVHNPPVDAQANPEIPRKELIGLRINRKVCTDCTVAKDVNSTGGVGHGAG